MTNIAEIPEGAWVTKSFERDVVDTGAGGLGRAYPTRQRVVGTLNGEHPNLGRVRIIPSTGPDLRVTDVNAYVHDDGTLERVPDTL
ncbi:hypothetical protein LJR042_003538 [Microbacterium maritypicum]|uniref:hypothetical protein n=1 Tax=Microbacterium maritypicum TaxID=33918 RepID=UPI003ECC8111